MPTATRQPESETARRLLDSARDAFSTKGFHGTSTREIAAGAQMSPAAMYIHYRSKEDVLFQLSLAGHTDAHAALVAATEIDGTLTEKLRSAVYAFAHWHAENHTTARIVQYERGALNEEHGRQIVELRRGIEKVMRDLVSAGVATGEFDVASIDIATLSIMSLCIDIVRWFPARALPDAESVGAAYASLAVRMVGAQTVTT